jgi:hypothetical protein
MKRRLRKTGAGACLLALAACGAADLGPARYGLDQCRRLALHDAHTGAEIAGAEDFTFDSPRERLFISSYDRRAVENAARKNAAFLPQGGVYAVRLEALFGDQTAILAEPLIAPEEIEGGLHPHGIAFDEVNNELVFVNRSYGRENGKRKMTPRLQRLGAGGEIFVGAVNKAPCAANDVLAGDGLLIASFDHGHCGWRGVLEDGLGLKRSGLADETGTPIFARALFANGLARTQSGAVALAATRQKALLLLERQSGSFVETARIDLPGGPDNLTSGLDGDIVAALHPSLMRLALNRRLGLGKAPSRIVKIDPETRAVALLFDDPKGALFSAATVAVLTQRGLVAGSVTDSGVLVCKATS